MAAPASPASAPLGVILQADRAQVGADVTSSGTTIYDGDRLQTQVEGTLRATLGGPQLYLRHASSAQVHVLPNGFSADLTGGTVVVSSAEGQAFQVLADGATIRPVGTQPVVAQVTWVSPKELRLTSSRGALQVTMGDEVKTIDAGSSYQLDVAPEASDPRPSGSGTNAAGSNPFVLTAIVLVIAGATTGVILTLLSPPVL